VNRSTLVALVVLHFVTSAVAQSIGPRTVQPAQRLFNVKTYGAVGNGVADDTLAIQAAENAAEAADSAGRGGGAVVYFPSGTYRLTVNNALISLSSGYYTAIAIRASNITWAGDGQSSILYVDDWAASTTIQAYVTVFNTTRNIENIEFHDFSLLSKYDVDNPTFDSAVPAGFLQCGGITATPNVNNCGFRNLHAAKIGGDPFNFNGGDANSSSGNQNFDDYAINNEVVNSGYGGLTAFSGGVADCIFAHNRFYKVRGLAIESSCMRQIVTDNVFDTILNSGFDTDSNSAQDGWSIVAHNTFLNVGKYYNDTSSPCISLGEAAGALRFKIFGNVMRNCYGQGIAVGGATIHDIDISDNYIDGFAINGQKRTLGLNAGWAGIAAQNGTRVSVTNNHVRAPTGASDNGQFGIITGGSEGADNWTDGNVTDGSFRTAPFITNCSAGVYGAGTNNRVGRNYDLTTGVAHYCFNKYNAEAPPVVPGGSTIPSLAGADTWLINNSMATTITNFTGGSIGETKTLIFVDTNTTIGISGGTIFGNGGKDWSSPHAYTVAKCTAVSNLAWSCVFGS
jgi:hypothetical protein